MRTNVKTLAKLTENLETARDELEQINKEEALLEWEVSQFPVLQQMFQLKDPYDKLWNTALTFENKRETWLDGRCCRSVGIIYSK